MKILNLLPLFLAFICIENLAAQEETLDLKINGLDICGALLLPEQDTCFTNMRDTCYFCDSLPVVIMVHDEGEWNLNEDIIVSGAFQGCLNPGLLGKQISVFKDLAVGLEAGGVGSFRYCKRTFLYNEPIIDFETLSPYDFVSDAAQVVTLIDSVLSARGILHKIYLLGHGQGGHLLAEVTDSLTEDVVHGYLLFNSSATGVDTSRAEFVEHIYGQCLSNPTGGMAAYDSVLATYNRIRNRFYPYNQTVNTQLPGNQTLGLGHPYFSEAWMTITDTFIDKYEGYDKPMYIFHGGSDQFINPANHEKFMNWLDVSDIHYEWSQDVKHLLVSDNENRVSQSVIDPMIDWFRSKCDTLYNTTTSTSRNLQSTGCPEIQNGAVSLSSCNEHCVFLIHNLHGQLIRSFKKNEWQRDIQFALNPGMYLLTTLHDGQLLCSQKLQVW